MPDAKDYDVEKSHSIGMFIRNDGAVFTVTELGELIAIDEPIYAMGAGQDFAWGALEMGATARQAIEITMRRSDYAGIGVDEITLVE